MRSNLCNKINIFRITILVGFIAASCDGDRQVSIDKYFNIQELIDKQVKALQAHDVLLIKTLKIDGKTENQSLTELDGIQWEKEFKIFREHDINRPVLVDAYLIEEKTTPDNFVVRSYNLIDSSQSGILNMEIKSNQTDEVISLESTFSEENILYSNLREVSMNFHPDGALITGYTIQGYHKLMFTDTVHYQLKAVLNYE